MNEEPITTYKEKVRAKRLFELYPDKIRIQCYRRFGARYDISVKLQPRQYERSHKNRGKER